MAIDKQLGSRTPQADDMLVTLRVSLANLSQLEQGVAGSFSEIQLVRQDDGAYVLAVKSRDRAPTPNPVNERRLT